MTWVTRPVFIVVIAWLAVAGACDSPPRGRPTETPPDTGPAWFEEVAANAGLKFEHVRGPAVRFWFPEIMSGGAALFDYDNDGDLDAYLVQGGDLDPAAKSNPTNRLFRNRGDGTFEDVTAAAGVGDDRYGMGCTCADYDADGDIDLYVTNVGANVLYRNNGDGSFTDVTDAMAVGDAGWSSSAVFVDYDNDGDLDLFVANYVAWSILIETKCYDLAGRQEYCLPAVYRAQAPDRLYRNDGDRFVDVSESAGLRTAFGYGLGVAVGDFNMDGRTDLYVANDGTPNQLWINAGDGTFEDDALMAGCSVNMQGTPEAGMGVTAVDLDHDADLDLFMTHLRGQTNTLYANDGDGLFEDITPRAGLSLTSFAYTGFGTGFADFDHDGRLDIYIANGRVTRGDPRWDESDAYAEPNQLLRGLDGGRFEEIKPAGGTRPPVIGTSRAAAFGDVDNDGDVDVLVVDSGGPVRLLRNIVDKAGAWIMFRVLDRDGTDALGATVEITSGRRRLYRHVHVAYSYCASSDPRIHAGLGNAARADRVRVQWLDGQWETFGPLNAGRLHVLRRGAEQSEDAPQVDLSSEDD
ncbi:MAG: CRTAC1 family protein [Phycisphaerae bacterium]